MSKKDLPAGQAEGAIQSVEIDALVVLQIMKHCKHHTPSTVTGQLLGLDVDGVLQVTHSFGVYERGEETQHDDRDVFMIDMQKSLRDVNVDSNVVGWYQTTQLGQIFSNTTVDTQRNILDYTYLYQSDMACSIFLVYDPLQAAIGKPSFKALQMTPQFLSYYAEYKEGSYNSDQNRSTNLQDIPTNEMFMEIPVYIKSAAIVEAFLLEWSLMDSSTTSQIESLDTENQVFAERNMQLLIGALEGLAQEQQKLQMYEKMLSGGDKGKGKGKNRNAMQPKKLDTMILSREIQNYCKQINDFCGDSFGKLFLLSNKPGSVEKDE